MVKIYCEKCKKRCRGDVLRVSNRYFHKGCFTCSKCNRSLETGGFFMKDNGFYCQDDYQRYFVAKCKVCAKDLVGEIVTVMNFSFHRECFKCNNCAIPFHPGDRVTVWHERFYCPNCISQERVLSPTPKKEQQKLNGNALSPLSVTDDEGCISDVASPAAAEILGKDETDNARVNGFKLPSSDARCITSLGVPQKSKSILRKSGTDGLHVRTSFGERGYLSTDSGLGERLYDSKNLELEATHIRPTGRQSEPNHSVPQPSITSPIISSHQSRQSLIGRVPNSDYGRFLNRSYMTLGDRTTSTQMDRYKRNVSFNAINNTLKPKHFHIPENKSRFPPPGTKTHAILFGLPLSTATPRTSTPKLSVTPTHKPMASSAMELNRQPPSERSPSAQAGKSVETEEKQQTDSSHPEEDEVTMEAIRLASYPAGHQRDRSMPAPIERYDWPGPPASAVVLAELMRERRYRRREEARANGLPVEDGDDAESHEALSIDYSFDGGPSAGDSGRQMPGIGQAILREEAEQRRRCRSQQLVDPISASRTPSAAAEPLFKPRYSTHQFVCSSVRPGYTAGRLTSVDKTASLPASSLLLGPGRYSQSSSTWTSRNATMQGRMLSPGGQNEFRSREYTSALNGLDQVTSTDFDGATQNRVSAKDKSGVSDRMGQLNGLSTLSYPSVLFASTPSAVFRKPPPPLPKPIPYEELKTYRHKKPKGIDRTALETHLTDEEFQQVFHLQRSAFYHLPEWKRNDLKRRAELF
ncbi:unnamed protein product [Calicophoron daubneyi]|uniref:Actin-binding LIM protein 1 n=1 Tax=Calicophoron daubneyi TaxID=300641 RepID=A0AAV2TK84_CALDB